MNNKKMEENMYISQSLISTTTTTITNNLLLYASVLKYQAKGKRSRRIQLNGKFSNKIVSREEILTN